MYSRSQPAVALRFAARLSGLASGLALDVHPRVAMQILRHSKIAITMEIYTEVVSSATREAFRKLGRPARPLRRLLHFAAAPNQKGPILTGSSL